MRTLTSLATFCLLAAGHVAGANEAVTQTPAQHQRHFAARPDWLNGTGSKLHAGEPDATFDNALGAWTMEDLMHTRFAKKISDDIDLDPCKSGE